MRCRRPSCRPGKRFRGSASRAACRPAASAGVNAALMELRGRAGGQDHDSLDDVDGACRNWRCVTAAPAPSATRARAVDTATTGACGTGAARHRRLETPGNRRAAADGRRQFQGTAASCARPVARTAGRHDMSTHEHDFDHDLLARLRALPNEREVPTDGWARLSARLPPRGPQAAPAPTGNVVAPATRSRRRWWLPAGAARLPARRSTRWPLGGMRSRIHRCRPRCSCRRLR